MNPTPTPNPIEITFGDLMKQANDLFPFLLIGIIWSLSRRVIYLIRPDLFISEKRKNEELSEEDSIEEKPKRHTHWAIGDDGEIEVIEDE